MYWILRIVEIVYLERRYFIETGPWVRISYIATEEMWSMSQPARENALSLAWVSYQIRKYAGCAYAGNAGNVFPATDFKWNRSLAIQTCITARALRTESLTRGGGENVPGIPGACATRNNLDLVRGPLADIFRIRSETIHGKRTEQNVFTSYFTFVYSCCNMSVHLKHFVSLAISWSIYTYHNYSSFQIFETTLFNYRIHPFHIHIAQIAHTNLTYPWL